jgi:hypothetical protein
MADFQYSMPDVRTLKTGFGLCRVSPLKSIDANAAPRGNCPKNISKLGLSVTEKLDSSRDNVRWKDEALMPFCDLLMI